MSFAPAPGLAGASRRRRHAHYELMSCALKGHALADAHHHALRREMDGATWQRCLRCDAWLPVPPDGAPPAAAAPPEEPLPPGLVVPLRGGALRQKYVLRAIAVDRAFHFVILLALAIALFAVAAHESALRGTFFRIVSDLQGPVAASTQHPGGMLARVREILSLRTGTLDTIGAVALAYAVLEGVEAVGLWLMRRWAEYLTFVATTLLLPLEVYELSHRLTVFKVIAFAVNLAVVVYLLLAKRLFGLRGGAAADEAERERDSGWDAVLRATPPRAGAPQATPAPTRA